MHGSFLQVPDSGLYWLQIDVFLKFEFVSFVNILCLPIKNCIYGMLVLPHCMCNFIWVSINFIWANLSVVYHIVCAWYHPAAFTCLNNTGSYVSSI